MARARNRRRFRCGSIGHRGGRGDRGHRVARIGGEDLAISVLGLLEPTGFVVFDGELEGSGLAFMVIEFLWFV